MVARPEELANRIGGQIPEPSGGHAPVETERALLGQVLLNGWLAFREAGTLEPSDFTKHDHQEVWGAVLRVVDAKRAPHADLVADALGPSGLETITPLLDAGLGADVGDLAQALRDASAKRDLEAAGLRIREDALRNGRSVAELMRRAHQELEKVEGRHPAPSPLASLGQHRDWFDTEPEKLPAVLRYPGDDGAIFLPGGCVGVLSGAGGSGKSMMMLQLGMALATRRPWLDRFAVASDAPRKSLLLFGEDPKREVHKRMLRVSRAWGLDEGQQREVAQNMVAEPMHGQIAPLLQMDGEGRAAPTEHFLALERYLTENAGDDGWGFLMIDPLSRFAGVEAEMDNMLATQLVQFSERLANAPGKPAVILVGHSSKVARGQGQADARGVTGLTDAARFHWTISRDKQTANVLEFRQEKANYTRPMEPMTLEAHANGVIREECEETRAIREQSHEDAREEAASKRVEKYRSKLLEFLGGRSAFEGTQTELADMLGSHRRQDRMKAVRLAAEAEEIAEAKIDGERYRRRWSLS